MKDKRGKAAVIHEMKEGKGARTDEFTFSEEPLRAENEFIQPQFTLTLHSHCVNV